MCSQLDADNILDIAFWEIYKEGIEICYPIFVGLMVNYKE